MSLKAVGGNDFNDHIATGRQVIKENRDALMILRHKIIEAIRLNSESTDLVVFLLELSAQLETISQGTDELGRILEALWVIGAKEKLSRKGNDDG